MNLQDDKKLYRFLILPIFVRAGDTRPTIEGSIWLRGIVAYPRKTNYNIILTTIEHRVAYYHKAIFKGSVVEICCCVTMVGENTVWAIEVES